MKLCIREIITFQDGRLPHLPWPSLQPSVVFLCHLSKVKYLSIQIFASRGHTNQHLTYKQQSLLQQHNDRYKTTRKINKDNCYQYVNNIMTSVKQIRIEIQIVVTITITQYKIQKRQRSPLVGCSSSGFKINRFKKGVGKDGLNLFQLQNDCCGSFST